MTQQHISAILLVVVLYGVLIGCSDSKPSQPTGSVAAARYVLNVVNTFPHDSAAFTQGLQWVDTLLVEGTGIYGQSSLRLVDLPTGDVIYSQPLPLKPGGGTYFGEGVCVVGDSIYQLTWQGRIGFIYNKNTFDSVGYFTYPTEGWGLTHDGSRFILSDGTARIYFWDSLGCHDCAGIDANTIPHIDVNDAGQAVTQLNELEYINGEIYANIWNTDMIVRIDPSDGVITAWLDCRGLLTPFEQAGANVLNGIAYDANADRLFLTGKYWPKLFEVEPVRADSTK